MKSTRLFISKSQNDVHALRELCSEKNVMLEAHSFLSFQMVPAKIYGSPSVLFFASPRAAKYYFDQIPYGNEQIAVAGDGTKAYIEQLGFAVNFTPLNSGNVEESAQAFAQFVGNQQVLFPSSNISNKSYSQFLNPSQVEIVTVYETLIQGFLIPLCDIYAFTSPSNVRGFLQANSFPANCKIVAWGESTRNELVKTHPDHEVLVLTESTDLSLWSTIQHLI